MRPGQSEPHSVLPLPVQNPDGDIDHAGADDDDAGATINDCFTGSVEGYMPGHDIGDQCGVVVGGADRDGERGGAAVAGGTRSSKYAIRTAYRDRPPPTTITKLRSR